MSTDTNSSVKIEGIGPRIKEAFGSITSKKIAERIGVTEGAMANYIAGRATLPILMRISQEAQVSLDWLVTGKGQRDLDEAGEVSVDWAIEKKMRRIAREEMLRFTQGIIISAIPEDTLQTDREKTRQ